MPQIDGTVDKLKQIAPQWLMGRLPCKYVEDVRLIIKRKINTGPEWRLE